MWLKFKRLMRFIKNNPTQVIFYIVFTTFLVGVGFYVLNRARTYLLDLEIATKNQQLQEKQTEFETITATPDYKRYVLADYMIKKQKWIAWKNTIESLIFMYDKIKWLNWDDQWVTFENFKIDMDKIKISVSSPDIKKVYTSGWIIDRFVWLDFIKNLNIPSYTKEGPTYRFNLDAKIKIDDSAKQ